MTQHQSAPPEPRPIEPAELRDALALDPARVLLVDVREPNERAYAAIPAPATTPQRHLPLSQYPACFEAFDTPAETADRTIVVYCHHGVRSHAAGRVLLALGHRDVRSLVGGIDAWSLQVDPTVPRY